MKGKYPKTHFDTQYVETGALNIYVYKTPRPIQQH